MNKQNTPLKLENVISMLQQTNSQNECLALAYNIVSDKYHGERLYTLTHFFNLFRTRTDLLWQSTGVMHCTNINRLLKYLLLESKLFSGSDIKTHWTLLWFISPHQYLEVKTNTNKINIDVWAKNFGIKFGDYAHGWHLKTK